MLHLFVLENVIRVIEQLTEVAKRDPGMLVDAAVHTSQLLKHLADASIQSDMTK